MGIIPAHAGFTISWSFLCVPAPDHPRTRGVYITRWGERPAGDGSSPHTRGLLRVFRCGAVSGGIIPAHAGFTVPGLNTCLPVMDHPRTRGVYYSSVRVSGIMSGSSPHARGLLCPA